jgi:DNA-binding transcriptional LysR family regulator
MRISHVKEFIKLAESLSFTRTAEEAYTTQPVISRHVMALEAALGARLLTRSTHSVALTDEGRIALASFQKMAAQHDALLRALGARAKGLAGPLAIGILYYAIEDYHDALVAAFKEAAPEVEVSLLSYQPPALAADLEGGRIDAGITLGPAAPEGAGVAVKELGRERMVLLCREGHFPGRAGPVGLKDLRGQAFVFMRSEAWHEPYVTALLKARGIGCQRRIYTDQIDTLPDAIVANRAVAVVASHVATMRRRQIAALPIKAAGFEIPIALAYLADNRNPCLKAFLGWLEASYRGPGAPGAAEKPAGAAEKPAGAAEKAGKAAGAAEKAAGKTAEAAEKSGWKAGKAADTAEEAAGAAEKAGGSRKARIRP